MDGPDRALTVTALLLLHGLWRGPEVSPQPSASSKRWSKDQGLLPAPAPALPLATGVDLQITLCDRLKAVPIGCSACSVCSALRQKGVVL